MSEFPHLGYENLLFLPTKCVIFPDIGHKKDFIGGAKRRV